MIETTKYNFLNSNDKVNIDRLFKILEKLTIKHPYLVILILHEYYRSLYSFDPYIKLPKSKPLKRIRELTKRLSNFANLSLKIGSYNVNLDKSFFFNYATVQLGVQVS